MKWVVSKVRDNPTVVEAIMQKAIADNSSRGAAAEEFLPTEGCRNGIRIQKGVALTKEMLDRNFELLGKYMEHYTLYPDTFLDDFKSVNCPINLYFYQRIALRSVMRYRYVSATFTRAFSKSFISILGMFLRCVFLPNSKLFLCSEYKSASLKITKQKIDEIFMWYPILENEVLSLHQSNDYIEIIFKNGSQFSIVSMTAASRGQRATGGTIEESALVSGEALTSIILPMMCVDRRTRKGKVNPTESHQLQNYITTAGPKSCYMYDKLIELVCMEVIDPSNVFIWGGDYRLPVYHGQLSKKFMDEQRMSTTFEESSFAREYLSVGFVWADVKII